MLEVGDKIDDDNTSAGELTAEEFNSLMTEAENVIKPFMTLDGAKVKQMSQSIDIMSKALFYTDAGTVNAVQLTRSATTETTETLFNGMTIYFLPSNTNTGATTLKVTTLTAKPLKYNGLDLVAGYLNTTSKYVAVYDLANDRFNVDVIAGGSAKQAYKVADAVNNDEAVSKLQMEIALAGIGLKISADGLFIVKTDGSVIKNQCTAWVNFDGADATIRDNFNFSTVIRNSTAKYSVSFDVAMDSVNYAIVALGSDTSGDVQIVEVLNITVNGFDINSRNSLDSSSYTSDRPNMMIVVFGGKA